MSKKLYLILVLLFSIKSFGAKLDSLNQGFYVKISSHYHTPVSYQNSPAYFQVPVNFTSSGRYELVYPKIEPDFSFAKGQSYEFKIGKIYSNNIGFEIGINSFNAHREYGQTSIAVGGTNNYNSTYTTVIIPTMVSDFSTLYLKPAIIVAKNLKESSILMKGGLLLSNSKLTQTYLNLATYRMKNHLDLGYFMGIDYNLRLSNKIGFSFEIGIENLFYSPKEAILDNPNLNYPYTSTITYVDNYSSQTSPNVNAVSISNNNSSSILLTQTTKLNSLYFGMGLNYNFYKK